jgi:hypothetical protein
LAATSRLISESAYMPENLTEATLNSLWKVNQSQFSGDREFENRSDTTAAAFSRKACTSRYAYAYPLPPPSHAGGRRFRNANRSLRGFDTPKPVSRPQCEI